jgi:hypothetical protein
LLQTTTEHGPGINDGPELPHHLSIEPILPRLDEKTAQEIILHGTAPTRIYKETWGYAETPAEVRSQAIQKARNKLAEAGKAKPELVASLLNLGQMPRWLRQAINEGLDTSDNDVLLARLIETSEDGGHPLVPERTLRDVMWIHTLRLTRQQHELNARAPGLIKQFREQIANTDWLPKDAALNADNRLALTSLLADDGFNTEILNKLAMTTYNTKGNVIILGPKASRHTCTHEFCHLLPGTDGAPDGLVRATTGLQRIFGDTEGAAVLSEAITEQTALALERGKIDLLDPYNNHHHDRYYYGAGMMLESFCWRGKHPIDIRLFIGSAYENESTRPDSASRQLVANLRTAFPGLDIAHELAKMQPTQGGQRPITRFPSLANAASDFSKVLRAHGVGR